MLKDNSTYLNPINFQRQRAIDAILQGNLDALKNNINSSDCNTTFNGATLLDLALIHKKYDIVNYLQEFGHTTYFVDQKSAQQHGVLLNRIHAQNHYKIKVETDAYGHYQLQIQNVDISHNEIILQITLDQQQLQTLGTLKGNLAIGDYQGTRSLIILGADLDSPPQAIIQLNTTGTLNIHSCDMNASLLSIDSNQVVNLSQRITVKTLNIIAKQLVIEDSATVQTQNAYLDIKNNITHKGTLCTSIFTSNSTNFYHQGKTLVSQEFDFSCRGEFHQQGNLIGALQGKIKAHAFENHTQSCLLITEGRLKIWGGAYLKNSGSIISDYLTLDSKYLINNYYGALIKAVTCIVPYNEKQFNNAGFYLVGHKNNLTAWSKAFDCTNSLLSFAGMFSLINGSQKLQLETGLLLGKTLLHSADILKKLYSGKYHEITNEEWINLFLDKIIPAAEKISGTDSRVRWLCNSFYQFWGAGTSEEDYLDKSLNIVELVINSINKFSGGRLNKDQVALLEQVASTLKYSRKTLTVARPFAEVMTAFFRGDELGLKNAQQSILAISESFLRDTLSHIEPQKLFDFELNPKDLALFIINQGHQQPFTEKAKCLINSSLYALHKANYLNDEQKPFFQYASQVIFSSVTGKKLIEKYHTKELTSSQVIYSIFSQATFLANYLATMKQLEQRKNQENLEKAPAQSSEETTLLTENPETIDDSQTLTIEPEDSEQAENKETIDEAPEENTKEPEEYTITQPETQTTEDANTEEKTKATEEEVQKRATENAEEYHVDYERQSVNLKVNIEQLAQDIFAAQAQQELENQTSLFDNFNLDTLLSDPKALTEGLCNVLNQGMRPEYAQIMLEIQKVLNGNGDGDSQGYLGIFANTLHNEGILDTVGNLDLLFHNADNSSYMRSTENIFFNGFDAHNRNEQGKVNNTQLSEQSLSSFTNTQSGIIRAEHSADMLGVGNINHKGTLQAAEYKNHYGNKFTENDTSAHLSTEKDLNIIADQAATNAGTMSGENVHLEGNQEKATNSGQISAKNTINYVSTDTTQHDKSGSSSAQQVNFKSTAVEKEGTLKATLVKTQGYTEEQPENITWRTGEDNVFGLILNPQNGFEYDSDAFNHVQITDLQLNEAQLTPETLLNLDPNFSNTLSLKLAESNREFSVSELPQLNPDATFILDAPGSTLQATQEQPCTYPNTLHYIGNTFQHSGSNTFKQAYFDTESFIGEDAHSKLMLTEGGGIQTKNFTNQGQLKSDGVIFWNVDEFTNDAQLKTFIQSFIYSNKALKEGKPLDNYTATALVENSGTIHAKGHQGYIGELNQTGGSFTSDNEGNHLYIQNSNLKPIFTYTGQYSLDNCPQDIGKSWYVLPEAHNAKLGSSGENVLLGTGALHTSGANIWGDTGTHLHFNEGIHKTTESKEYDIYETKKKTNNLLKNDQITVPFQRKQIVTSNNISSNEGVITLAASQGSINLTNTVFSFPGNAAMIARDKITIDAQQVSEYEKYSYTQHNLLNNKKVKSETHYTEVQSSLLFVGGTLMVSCLDFNLKSVSGYCGNMDVTAMTTNLSGTKQTYSNTTNTQDVTIGLPTDNLMHILSNHNAKAIFSTLIQNCGWEPAELEALLDADSVSEIPGHLLNTAKNVWDITAFVSHACNSLYQGSPGEFVGSVTDKLGLTTMHNGSRIPNAKVTLNWKKTKEKTEHSKMIATNLQIGGTFRLFGSKLIVADGSKIHAKDLIISLAKGIEMTKGVEKYEFSSQTKSATVGMNLVNPKEVSVGANVSKQHIEHETPTLAGLHASNSANIEASEYIHGEGQISAPTGTVTAKSINLSSAQTTHNETNESFGVKVSSDLSSIASVKEGNISANYHQEVNNYAQTTDRSGIFFSGEGTIKANTIHLENGAILKATEVIREDNSGEQPTITGTIAKDFHEQKTTGGSVHLAASKYEPGGALNHKNKISNTEHNPSVYANNINENEFSIINTIPENESKITKSSSSGFSVAAFIPNCEQRKEQAQEMKMAATNIGNSIENGARALNFMFKGNPTTAKTAMSPTIIQDPELSSNQHILTPQAENTDHNQHSEQVEITPADLESQEAQVPENKLNDENYNLVENNTSQSLPLGESGKLSDSLQLYEAYLRTDTYESNRILLAPLPYPMLENELDPTPTEQSGKPSSKLNPTKTHTVRAEKDKNGKNINRKVDNGQFSKSASKLAKESREKGEWKDNELDFLYKPEALNQHWEKKYSYLGVEANTVFQAVANNKKMNLAIGTSISFTTVEKEYSVDNHLGEFNAKFSGPSADLNVTAQISRDGKQISAELKHSGFAKLANFNVAFESKPQCFETSKKEVCMNLKAQAEAGIGTGKTIGNGVTNNKTKTESSASSTSATKTDGAGSGFYFIFKLQPKIEINDLKDNPLPPELPFIVSPSINKP
jgi:hypothetical protein